MTIQAARRINDGNTLLSINNYHYLRGGAERVFLDHNYLYSRAGWKVVPFCMDHPNNLDSQWSNYFVNNIEFGNSYSTVDMVGMIPKVIYSMEARHKITELCKIISPSICHVHNIYHHISPSILSAISMLNIPIVMSLHDLKVVCPAYTMFNSCGVCEKCKQGNLFNVVKNRCIKNSLLLSSLVYIEATLHKYLRTYEKYVDRFIVPSLFLQTKLIEWGFESDKLIYIPNFVDAHDVISREDISNEFVYFGRLSPEKGISTFILAAAKAKVAVRIVGVGPEEDSLRKLALKVGCDAQFCGYLSGEKLKESISRCLAVVLPSECYENAPLSILEAYSQGKLVVGSSIGGIPELVIDGETGFLFETGSVDNLAEKLEETIRLDAVRRSNMSINAHEFVQRNHNSAAYMKRVNTLYHELSQTK